MGRPTISSPTKQNVSTRSAVVPDTVFCVIADVPYSESEERVLAEQLGVSRPTVREAMIALELSGVIEIRSGSGIYAIGAKPLAQTQLTDTGIGPFEILEIRLMLESEACALAAARVSNTQLAESKQCLDDMIAIWL